MIIEKYKGVPCVDLGESFQTHIFLQNIASIQPRTSPVKFARSSPVKFARSEGDGFEAPWSAMMVAEDLVAKPGCAAMLRTKAGGE